MVRLFSYPTIRRPDRSVLGHCSQGWTEQRLSVCITFLVRNKNQYYVLDIYRKRRKFTELCDAVQALATKHKANVVLVEEHAAGTPLIDECKRRGMSTIIGRRKQG